MPKSFFSIALLSLVLVSAAAPVSYSPARGLHEATLACQDGTCCPELGSTCVIGEFQRPDKYYKESGSCTTPPPVPQT